MTEATTAQEITVTRIFDAPRDAVWKAWTEPAQLAHWWGAPGWATPESGISVDLRVGGTMRLTSRSDEHGGEMTTVGTFTEVVEPERLSFEEASEDSWHEGADSTVTFADLGDGRTEMTLRSTVHMTDELAAQAEAGLRGAIDRLAELLA
jgi:uncharacterized protein YndB with AHSA1/START domain